MDASSSSMFRIFDTAASGMLAQSVRLNTTASNMANADSVASSPEQVYRARQPVFAAIQSALAGDDSASGVRVLGIVESQAPVNVRYDPGNPLANAEGNVFAPNVNPVDELVNMISASRTYQNNVEIMNSAKQAMLDTLSIGR
ncbi:MAG: flagellar basal body rod protein FlgC [Xanthomonadaceae bacterium]|nr:flagellar basal body rod protein FlgC [Xanthomonadaceae bacterium]MDP2184560.1 flagellar basal body rod protein FlgC [Xanthomonadales bacterium]MDZ4116357.1 flagellar basal body rod protein FlgC [Xanthomonadaceae bacterium]MDZ4378904.1 flagellar basal body rod protein FlgC [Xanthomonadaceae bacterium]